MYVLSEKTLALWLLFWLVRSGQGFLGDGAQSPLVSVGGVNCTVTSSSNTSIVCEPLPTMKNGNFSVQVLASGWGLALNLGSGNERNWNKIQGGKWVDGRAELATL